MAQYIPPPQEAVPVRQIKTPGSDLFSAERTLRGLLFATSAIAIMFMWTALKKYRESE